MISACICKLAVQRTGSFGCASAGASAAESFAAVSQGTSRAERLISMSSNASLLSRALVWKALQKKKTSLVDE